MIIVSELMYMNINDEYIPIAIISSLVVTTLFVERVFFVASRNQY